MASDMDSSLMTSCNFLFFEVSQQAGPGNELCITVVQCLSLSSGQKHSSLRSFTAKQQQQGSECHLQ